MLRAAFRHAGGVRIDHAMGLARLWVVPEGMGAGRRRLPRAIPIDDMLRLLALESHRHRAIVIGEDLGTLPQGFQDRMAEPASSACACCGSSRSRMAPIARRMAGRPTPRR